MKKEDKNVAIWLFVLCFGGSWCWIVSWKYNIGLYPSLFCLGLSGLSYYIMWRIIRYVAVNTGWKEIGIINPPVQDELCKHPSRIPIIMQIVLDVCILSISPIQKYLGSQFTFLDFTFSSLMLVLISVKWHKYYLAKQNAKA